MTPTQSQTEIQTGKLKHTHEDTVPGLQSRIQIQTHICTFTYSCVITLGNSNTNTQTRQQLHRGIG